MRWHSKRPDNSMRARLEKLVEQMGSTPIVGLAVDVGVADASYISPPGRAWIVAEDALFQFDYVHGKEIQESAPSGVIPVWKVDGRRVEWRDADPMWVSVSGEGGRTTRLFLRLGEHLLKTDAEEERTESLAFAHEYLGRWRSKRPSGSAAQPTTGGVADGGAFPDRPD